MICMKNLRFSSRPRAKFRRQGPPGSARAQPWFKIIRYLQGCLKCKTIVVSTFKPQCSTLTTGTCILDTRQWASMWNKSLAHTDKPLVKKNVGYRNFMTPYHFQTEIVCSYGKCRFDYLWTLLFEDTQVHSQFIFPSMNCSHGYVLFQLGWKLLAGFVIALLLLFMLCLVPW